MPEQIILKPGMEFVTRGEEGSILTTGINLSQKFWSTDNNSFYNHAGLLTDDKANTFEALWKLDHYNLNEKYEGRDIYIVERIDLTPEQIAKGLEEIQKLDGSWYPVLRFPLHLLHLAKYIHWKYPVCSELVAKYEYEMGVRKQWWGITPDNLADEWTISKFYRDVYKGKWSKNLIAIQ